MYLKRNNKLVWDETVKIMQGLFNDLWANQDVISINHVVDMTLPVGCLIVLLATSFFFLPGKSIQIALFVIGAAGIHIH